jgi:PPM family protein phosphatase
MKIVSAYFSRSGPKRDNQDSVLPLLEVGGSYWAAIADGMGGHAGGAIASRTATDALRAKIELNKEVEIPRLFSFVHEMLSAAARQRPDLQGMGTTLSLIRIFEGKGFVGHVGDSRIYHLRGNGLVDRTIDQTEVEQLIQRGVLNRANARQYARRNILLSVLSPEKTYDLHEETFDIKKGDRLILLTDGVSSKLLRQEIRDLSLEYSNAEEFCRVLASRIDERAPRDDFSAICLDIKSL